MMKRKNNHSIAIVLSVIFAMAVWLFLFRGFYLGKIKMFDDGRAYLYLHANYWSSIIRGVYPMWFPFYNWGISDEINLRFIGEYNPLANFPLILLKSGVPFQVTYFLYAIGYYFIGVVGFYFISLRIFRNQAMAVVSFLLLLFSSLGINIFYNYCEIVISACAIWFFYFLIAFFQDYDRKSFFGLTFSTMIIMVTYIPFYFLTIFLAFGIGYLILFPKEAVDHFKKLKKFIQENKLFVLGCTLLILTSAIPGGLWYLHARSGEEVMNYRQAGSNSKNLAAVGKSVVSAGGLVGPFTFSRLFSGLSFLTNQLSYYFLSFWIYLVLLASVLNRVTRRMVLCFFMTLSMFLISLAYSSDVHSFLFDHVFYFRMMRNIYYLFQMSIPFLIIFIVDQLRELTNIKVKTKPERFLLLGTAILAHAVFFIFLLRQEDVLVSSYLTLALSLVFFVLVILRVLREDSIIFLVVVLLLVIMQPVEVFQSYMHNLPIEKASSYSHVLKLPEFMFQRPVFSDPKKSDQKGTYVENSGVYDPGVKKYAGSFWSQEMLHHVPKDILQE